MSAFTAVDLANLPAPNLIEPLDFETIFEDMKADFIARNPAEYTALVESDPGIKLIEAAAYRELQVRQSFNERAKAVLLAQSRGPDLDNLAAFYEVERRLVDPGDPAAYPPIDPIWELDEDLRRRAQMAPEALTVAGSEGAYVFHALSAGQQPIDMQVDSPSPNVITVTYRYAPSPVASQVRHASVDSPVPGQVVVAVLSRVGDGTPSPDLVQQVRNSLGDEDVRPLTDDVYVNPAAIISYQVEAEITLYSGIDSELIRQAAVDAVQQLATERHRLGDTIALSAVDGALCRPGVQKARIVQPAGDIICTKAQAAFCTGITVTVAGVANV